jgi:hypothetical protein
MVAFTAIGNCTIMNMTVHITGAGSCTIVASQTGNANYNPAPDVSQSFNIAKATQSITFGAVPNKTFGDADFSVSATGGASGNPVTFTAIGNCTVFESTVHLTGAGSCMLTANQAGNSNYNSAPDVSKTFNIVRSVSTITLTSNTNPAASGDSVTFTATVQFLATGTVQFYDNGSPIGSPQAIGGGIASYTTSSLALGPHPITATYSGDINFTGATSTVFSEMIFAYPAGSAGGTFVVGDRNAVVGSRVTFWGAQWASLNTLSGGAAPSDFKGFASSTSSRPPNCGGTWMTGSGNSSGPPSNVPQYMAVIASSSINTSGSTVSGNTRQIVIVKTDLGYDSNPGHPGTGRVVAVVCQSSSGPN